MQTFKDGQVVSGDFVQDEALKDVLAEKMEQLKSGVIDQIVVANTPRVGETVTFKGIDYTVTHAFDVSFRAEITSG